MTRAVLGCLALLLIAGRVLAQAPAPAPAAAEPPGAPVGGPVVIEGETHEVPEAHELPGSVSCSACAPACWFRGEYLLWWTKQSGAPPLVTTGAATDFLPGALGQPGTAVLVGGALDTEEHSGGRFTAGTWLGEGQQLGVEATYFFLGTRSAQFANSSTDAPGAAVLGRPFFDVLAGREDSSLVAFPGLAAGTVTVAAPTYLQGAEANVLYGLWAGAHARLDLLTGFRWLELYEGLGVGENVQVNASAPVFAGDSITVADNFGTLNNFYGGQFGLRAALRRGAWDVDVTAKVALGDIHEVVTIGGVTTIAAPGQSPQVFNGGLLALPSNSGRFGHDAFAVVPEVGVNLGYHVTRWLRGYVGYTFLYCSDVVRPGDQVSRDVNRQQVATSNLFGGPPTGPAVPAFTRSSTDFWAQGVTFGLEFRY
jgi:hypothetical protein